jgi:hypothetical protein
MSDDSDDQGGGGDNNKGGRIPDAFRKAVVSGISALFVAEEGIRNMASDMRTPKDAMGYVVQQTDKTRRELFRIVSHEVKGFLRNADLTGELRRALIGLKVQVRAEVKFSEDAPDVAVKSRIKRRKRRTQAPHAHTDAAPSPPPAAVSEPEAPEGHEGPSEPHL